MIIWFCFGFCLQDGSVVDVICTERVDVDDEV